MSAVDAVSVARTVKDEDTMGGEGKLGAMGAMGAGYGKREGKVHKIELKSTFKSIS